MLIPDLKSKELKDYISLSQKGEFIISRIDYNLELDKTNTDIIIDIKFVDKLVNVKYKNDINVYKSYTLPKTIVVDLIDFNVWLRDEKFEKLFNE